MTLELWLYRSYFVVKLECDLYHICDTDTEWSRKDHQPKFETIFRPPGHEDRYWLLQIRNILQELQLWSHHHHQLGHVKDFIQGSLHPTRREMLKWEHSLSSHGRGKASPGGRGGGDRWVQWEQCGGERPRQERHPHRPPFQLLLSLYQLLMNWCGTGGGTRWYQVLKSDSKFKTDEAGSTAPHTLA